ncbi:hypothetical protein OZX72_06790 [Bifidobacterium sp. ESL0769]|uniref:hypothetical protein n=1 Tax=Bifidobacterium sp. ESL0769 TaxID=2983229 RepID=UPI0023F91D7C|nr:hypothetical protein [Bifidobacterium sp. ESL0769]WEV66953.1 hypothetical protein OZX72_06790 [Bifidobacterium sp. ESL0769]
MMDESEADNVVANGDTVPIAGSVAGRDNGSDSGAGAGDDWDSVVGPLPAGDRWDRLIGPFDRAGDPGEDDDGRPVKVPWYAPHNPRKSHVLTYVLGVTECLVSLFLAYEMAYSIREKLDPWVIDMVLIVAVAAMFVQGLLACVFAFRLTCRTLRVFGIGCKALNLVCLLCLVFMLVMERDFAYLSVCITALLYVGLVSPLYMNMASDLELKS